MTLLMHLQVLGHGSLMENVGMLPVDWGERLEASLPQANKFQVSWGLIHEWWKCGVLAGLTDWCGVSSYADTALNCHGGQSAEQKGEAFDLPINLRLNPKYG